MHSLSQTILCGIAAAVLLTSQVFAGAAYQYRAPDGNMVYTDKPLEAPYVLVNAMYLDWGDYKGREPEPITFEDEPEKSTDDDELEVEKLYVEEGYTGEKAGSYAAIINAAAEKYRLAPELIHAVIKAESNYNPEAVSHAGAVGMMQLMPMTAKRLGVEDSRDPAQNIEGGSKYLRELLDLFDNDLKLALAGYNAGEGAVMKYGNDIPPYKETQNYVKIVLRNMRRNFSESAKRHAEEQASIPVLKKQDSI